VGLIVRRSGSLVRGGGVGGLKGIAGDSYMLDDDDIGDGRLMRVRVCVCVGGCF
jgi:hypothetical protein